MYADSSCPVEKGLAGWLVSSLPRNALSGGVAFASGGAVGQERHRLSCFLSLIGPLSLLCGQVLREVCKHIQE